MDIVPWIVFSAIVIVMLALDLFVFHREAHVIPLKEAIVTSAFWIILALLFNVYVYFARGTESALNFLTGYLIEKSLSVDNLFVFLLIFEYFHTPKASMHKVLFWGILGAIIMRVIFIFLGIALITKFHWIIYVFGLFLIYTGIKLAWEKEKKLEPEANPILKVLRRFMPITHNYEGSKFFVIKNNIMMATPLFVVLIAIETSDIVFAVDSIPAILAITYDPFIVISSNIFAILGLRSLYFALSHMLSLFHYLHYGLAFILTFIGIKMCLTEVYPIPTSTSLIVVLLVLVFSVVASIKFPQQE